MPSDAWNPTVDSLPTALIIYHPRQGLSGLATLHNNKEGNAVRENGLPVAVPRLDRLMGLRDALVALKGPLAEEPGMQENLQKRLINEEVDNLVLGKLSTPALRSTGHVPLA